ncbi:unnamed protein product [Discosporangium mesarthrocarpum]
MQVFPSVEAKTQLGSDGSLERLSSEKIYPHGSPPTPSPMKLAHPVRNDIELGSGLTPRRIQNEVGDTPGGTASDTEADKFRNVSKKRMHAAKATKRLSQASSTLSWRTDEAHEDISAEINSLTQIDNSHEEEDKEDFLLHHESLTKLYWDTVMMFFILWSSIANPMEIGKVHRHLRIVACSNSKYCGLPCYGHNFFTFDSEAMCQSVLLRQVTLETVISTFFFSTRNVFILISAFVQSVVYMLSQGHKVVFGSFFVL